MAWDAAKQQMVLVIGLGGTGSGATWVWTGSHWSRPAAGNLPGAWFYSPMWSDPATGDLTAVGCCSGPPAPSGAVDATWRGDGSAWQAVATTTPAALDGSTMALDPSLGRLVLCTCGYSEPSEPELAGWTGQQPGRHCRARPCQCGVGSRSPTPTTGSFSSSVRPCPARQRIRSPSMVWLLSGSSWRRLG